MSKSLFDQLQKKVIKEAWKGNIIMVNKELVKLLHLPNLTLFDEDIRVFEYSLLSGITPRKIANKSESATWALETQTLEKVLWYIIFRTETELLICFNNIPQNLFTDKIINFIKDYSSKKWNKIKIITTNSTSSKLIDKLKQLKNIEIKITGLPEELPNFIISDWIDFWIEDIKEKYYLFQFNGNIEYKSHINKLTTYFNKIFTQ